MSAEELIEKLAIEVEGVKDKREIIIFTLSTCMWCKKCKRWLKERDVKYRYIDLDQIPYSQKSEILDYLKDNYHTRVSYPFVLCDKKDIVVGYDPNKYEELMKGGAA
jgi:glutaredoxin